MVSRVLDTSFDSPEKNLAYDEVLLLGRCAGHGGDTIRFWESTRPFVVLGTGQVTEKEAHVLHCEEDGIPVLRRCTAGGCVLQGPGVLNYTLALGTEGNPWARNLHESYCHILTGIAKALQVRGFDVSHAGTSDLAWDGMKVSGNAQRRRREAILHHGTLLHATDFGAMERYLKEPEDRPDYRGDRRHRQFVRALPIDVSELKEAVIEAFDATEIELTRPTHWELEETGRLSREKYGDPAWNRRR